jgi:putative glycosyltransferase (TIGR04348 family)
VRIITPYLAQANNGNWHTAARWARMLRTRYRVALAKAWTGEACDVLIALHARRSAPSIAAFASAHPERALVVVLTGTDLYRDIRADASAQRSLDLATALVVLQEEGLRELAPRHRRKAVVIHQSAPALARGSPRRRSFDVAVVGHMRDEKDPLTAMRVAELLPPGSLARILHAGAALDPAYADAARATQRRTRRYRWLGPLTRGRARQLMRNARLLLHPSKIEGGAHVILEAVRSGTPVVASGASGNVGMLGRGYPALFPVGDADAAARLIARAEAEPAFHRRLRAACARRAPLFAPARERAAVLQLVHQVVDNRSAPRNRSTA